MWSRQLDVAELYRVEDYLMAKYRVGVAMCVQTGVNSIEGGTEKVHVGTYPAALERVINADGGSGFFRGDIAEVVMFNTILSESERSTIERSMCLRWRSGCASVTMKVDLTGLSTDLVSSDVRAGIIAAVAAATGVDSSKIVIVEIVDTPTTSSKRRLLQLFIETLSISITIKFVGLEEPTASSLLQVLKTSTSFQDAFVSNLKAGNFVPSNSKVAIPPGGAPVAAGYVSTGFAVYAQSQKSRVSEGEYFQGEYRHSVTRIPVSRINGSDGSANVFYNTSDGTARGGTDYVPRSGYLTWNHGDMSDKYVEITVVDDDVREEPKSFFITISKSFSEFASFDVVKADNISTITTASTKEVEIIDNQLSQVYWTDISGSSSVFLPPSQGPSAGGFQVTITGNNFDTNTADYQCIWYTKASNPSSPCPSPIGARSYSWRDALTSNTMCALQFMSTDGSTPPANVTSPTTVVCKAPLWSLPVSSPVFLRLGQGIGAGAVGIDRVGSAYEFIFMGPVVTAAAPANVPTIGSASITLIGSAFGSSNVTNAMSADFNGQAASSVRWLSDSSALLITRTAGTGVRKNISLTIAGSSAMLAGFMSYDVPVVSKIDPANFSRVSGTETIVTISGKNFGTTGQPAPTVAIHEKECQNVTWVSDSSLFCKSDVQRYARFEQYGVKVNAVVTVDTLSGTGVDVFQFRVLPMLSSINPANGPTVDTNLRTITVFGRNFGYADNSPVVSFGDAVCNSSAWQSDSSIVCRARFQGFRHTDVVLRVPAYQGDGNVTLSNVFTFDAPQITSITVTNGPSVGGSPVTIQGFNFGNTIQAYRCWMDDADVDAASWISDSSAVCRTPPQTRGGFVNFQIKHETRSSNIFSGAFKFDAPCATKVEPVALPKVGGRIQVSGKNFGTVAPPRSSNQIFVTVGQTNCSFVTWYSDTSIGCVVLPGAGKGLSIRVSRWGSPASLGCSQNVSFGYNDLSLRGIEPFSAPVVGGTRLTVYGVSFGRTAPSSVKILVDSNECASSSWVSDSTLVCESVPGGFGTQLLVDVMVSRSDGRTENGTALSYFSYEAPKITGVSGDPSLVPLAKCFNLTGRAVSLARLGGALVTFIGKNFGLDGRNISLRVGSEPCVELQWLSDSSIYCKTPTLVRTWPSLTLPITKPVSARTADCYQDSDVTLTSRGRAATSLGLHYYIRDPVAAAIKPNHRPTLVAGNITVNGFCFGILDSSPTLSVSQTSMTQVAWISDTSIFGVVGSGSNDAHNITVELFRNTNKTNRPYSVLSSAFSYDAPVVTGITPGVGGTTGNTVITLYGQNFGPVSGLSVVASLGHKNCRVTTWTSDSMLTCVVPACTNSITLECNDLAVAPSVIANSVSSAQDRVSTFPKFSYLVPPIIDKIVHEQPVRGSGGPITIVGKNFMGTQYSGSARNVTVGGNPCVHVQWISDSAVRCYVPPGRGAHLTITVRVGAVVAHLYRTFSYYPDWMSILGPWGEPYLWFNSDDLMTIFLKGPYSARWVESWISRSGKSQVPPQLTGSDGTAPKFEVVVDGHDLVEQSIAFTGEEFLESSLLRNSGEATFLLVLSPGGNQANRTIFSEVNTTLTFNEYSGEVPFWGVFCPKFLPVNGLALFQNGDSQFIMQVGQDRVIATIPPHAMNASKIIVSMILKANACELRINNFSTGPQPCQPPKSKGNISLGRSPKLTYYTPTPGAPGHYEKDQYGRNKESYCWYESFTGKVFEFIIYDKALSSNAVSRIERSMCLERGISQCTSPETNGGVIQWNQPSVTVKEGQPALTVSVGRSGGSDGYASVFLRARALSSTSMCASILNMRVPSYCDSSLGSVVDLSLDQKNCSDCMACDAFDATGCTFWWEFGSGDDLDKSLTFDIPNNLLYQPGNRTIILELFDEAHSSAYGAVLGNVSSLNITVVGPDDVQWSNLDKQRVLGHGDIIYFSQQQGFSKLGNMTQYACSFWSLHPQTEEKDVQVYRSDVIFYSPKNFFGCTTPTDWVSSVKVLFLQVEDNARANPYESNILQLAGVSGGADFLQVSQYWTSVSPVQTSAGGVGSNVTVAGVGFTKSLALFCQWCLQHTCRNQSIDTTVQAKVVNATILTCRPPIWRGAPDAFFRVIFDENVIYQRNSSILPSKNMCKSDGSQWCFNGVQASTPFYFGWAWSSASPLIVPAAGGVAISLTGTGFQTCATTYTCHFTSGANSESSSATMIDDMTINCNSPYWSHPQNSALISLKCGSSTLKAPGPTNVTFMPVSVTGITPNSGLSTTGNSSLTIRGSQFGMPQNSYTYDLKIEVGKTACGVPTWISGTSVKCTVAPGISTQIVGINVTVNLASRSYVLSDALRYRLPSGLALATIPSPTIVQRILTNPIITITGSGFGPSNTSATLVVFVGNTSCSTTSWVNDATISCRPTPLDCAGPFAPVNVSVLVADSIYLVATASASVLTRPSFQPVQPLPTMGAKNLTILGANFGPADMNHSLTFGLTNCGPVTWTSDSSIQCSLRPGTGRGLKITMHTQGCDFDASPPPYVSPIRFSYHAPQITSIIPNRLPLVKAGSDLITLLGSNFGPFNDTTKIQVNLEGGSCKNVTWFADSAIGCRAKSSAMSIAYVFPNVSVDGVQGVPGVSFHFFNNPTVQSISKADIDVLNSSILISGIGFGFPAEFDEYPYVPVAKFGDTVSASTKWLNDSTIIALVPPGVGAQLRDIELNVLGLTSTISGAWKYAGPRVLNAVSAWRQNGTEFLAVMGVNYGTSDSSPRVRVGGSACVASEWTSDSSIKCKMPGGTGQKQDVSVTVAQQRGSRAMSFDYVPPAVTSISTARGSMGGTSYIPLAGNTVISVFGSGFGFGDTAVQGIISISPYNGSDSSPCNFVKWSSDSSLSCRTLGVFDNARYGLSLTFASGNNSVTIDPRAQPLLQLAASAPTCKSFADGLSSASRRAEPGYYLLDPSFGDNSDAVRGYCGLQMEGRETSTQRLGTNSEMDPPFLWLDPVADETISLDCDETYSATWNTSSHPINRAPCTNVKSWTSRQRGTAGPEILMQSDPSKRPKYIREDAEPARVEFDGAVTFLQASKLRPTNNILSAFIVSNVSSSDSGGFIVGDTDLYASPASGIGFRTDIPMGNSKIVYKLTVGTETFNTRGSISRGEFHLTTLVGTQTLFEMYVDGSLEVGVSKEEELTLLGDSTSSRGVNVNVGQAFLTLGRRATLGNVQPLFQGQMGDIVMFNRTMSPQERKTVERALCIKWNIQACAQNVSAGTIQWTKQSYVVKESYGYAVVGLNRTEQYDGYLELVYECKAHGSSRSLKPGTLRESWSTWTRAQQELALLNQTATFAAVDGIDFMSVTGIVSWGHSESGIKNFTIPLVDNELLQEPRSFECSVKLEEKTPIASIKLPATVVDVVVQVYSVYLLY